MKKVLLHPNTRPVKTNIQSSITIFQQLSLNNHYENYDSTIFNIFRAKLNIFTICIFLQHSSAVDPLHCYSYLINNVKNTLDSIKNQISSNQLKWEKHIKKNENIRKSKISRSYYKIKEIFNDIQHLAHLKKQKHICRMHLAEAPGGFIQFCNDFFDSQIYHTISINANNKIIPTFNNIIDVNKTINFSNNDITNIKVINHLISSYSNSYDIVTGDGGIFLNNAYLFQEQKSMKLIACEIYLSLHLLKNNGTCIIKFFDTFTKTSNVLIYILKKHFKDLFFHKPSCSRNTNSEKYVIAVNFKKYSQQKTLLESFHFLSTVILSNFNNLSQIDDVIKHNFQIHSPHFFDSLYKRSISNENVFNYNCIFPNRQGQHILNILNQIQLK